MPSHHSVVDGEGIQPIERKATLQMHAVRMPYDHGCGLGKNVDPADVHRGKQ